MILLNGFVNFRKLHCLVANRKMCSLFRNKYRVESCRLKGHDYSKGGSYFITICTLGKRIWFGEILNCGMVLTEPGHIAKQLWHELSQHYKFISLDEFVIMPDHIHGILIIHPNAHTRILADGGDDNDDDGFGRVIGRDVACNVSTSNGSNISKQPVKNEFMSNISPKHGSLGSVIRSYKSAVSRNLHMIYPDFSWEPRYYDHLIRSEGELNRIRKYIIDNPVNYITPLSCIETSPSSG
jgi:putative transposase